MKSLSLNTLALRNKARDLMALAVINVYIASSEAQGFTTAANNMTSLFRAVSVGIIAGGVVGGLGAIGWGVSEMIKKGGDRGDDISWLSIGYKIFGGAMLMVLGWIGGTAVETLGGSRGNIGAGV